jgi:hypothetical protein
LLVGDIIEKVRTLVVDQPQVYAPPINVVATPVNVGGGVVLPGTYTVVLTVVNNWGESTGTAPLTVTVAAGQNDIQIAFDTFSPNTHIHVYLTPAGSNLAAIFDYPNPFASNSFPGVTFYLVNIFQGVAMGNGNPPQFNSAYLPDTDGSTFSAGYLFKLLNEALHQASQETGGLKDYSGMPTIANNPFYVLQGQWPAINDLWYNGYWMQGGDRGWFFRRNTITSQILTTASMSIMDNRSILEIYPQPDRTAGTTTLVNAMGATDTSCLVVNAAFVLLPFGFIQIDSEIMGYYGLNGNTLQLSPRGIGGNPATTHLAGATVTELNLFFAGKRIFRTAYTPGQSATVLPVPDGWSSILEDYIMYRIRQAEQEEEKAQAYYKSFIEKTHGYAASNKQPMKRRQIGMASAPQSYFVTPTGGLILP